MSIHKRSMTVGLVSAYMNRATNMWSCSNSLLL